MVLRTIDGSDKKPDYGDEMSCHCNHCVYHRNRAECSEARC